MTEYIKETSNEICGNCIVATAKFHPFHYDVVKAITLNLVSSFTDVEQQEDTKALVDKINEIEGDNYQGWLMNDDEVVLEAWKCDYNTVTYIFLFKDRAVIVLPLSNFEDGVHVGFNLNIF